MKSAFAIFIAAVTVSIIWPLGILGVTWLLNIFFALDTPSRLSNFIANWVPSVISGAAAGFAAMTLIRIIAGAGNVKLLFITSGIAGFVIALVAFITMTDVNPKYAQLLPRVLVASALGYWLPFVLLPNTNEAAGDKDTSDAKT